MKRIISFLTVTFVMLYYNFVMWYGHVFELSQTVSPHYMKPYVYRPLVPLLVRGLEWVGVRVDIATIIITTIAGVGFYFALSKLTNNDTVSFVALFVGLFLFSVWHKIYDFMTVWLWTVLLIKILNRGYKGFSILFALLCLNRIETALFVILLYYLQERNWKFSALLFGFYTLMFLGIHLYFQGNIGDSALVEPIQNLHKLASQWIITLFHLSFFGVPFYLALQERTSVNNFYVLLFPVFVVLYVVFGQAFEVRVFWEIYPLTIFIFTKTMSIPELQNRKHENLKSLLPF